MINFAIPSLLASFILIFVFTFSSILNYKNRFKMDYHIRNYYPYELNYESKFKDNFTGNVAICLYGAFGIFFYTIFDSSYLNGFLIFDLIAGSLLTLALVSLVFIPLKRLKVHLLMVFISIVLAFLVPFSNALASSIAYRNEQATGSMVMMIVNALYCLFIFILIINPKLSHWAELKKETNPDGTVKYVRPKVFILALIEWLLILTSPLLMVLTLLTQQFGI